MIALALQMPLQEFLHPFHKILSYLLHVKHNSVLRKGKDEMLSSVFYIELIGHREKCRLISSLLSLSIFFLGILFIVPCVCLSVLITLWCAMNKDTKCLPLLIS